MTPFSTALKDQHVVLIGGSSGIGRATAEAVLGLGARATIVARSPEKLARVAADLSVLGAVAHASLDMTDHAAVRHYFDQLSPGTINHLVITASSAVHGAFQDLSAASVRRMFEAKFFGPYAVAQCCLPKLSPASSITFFSGVLSRRPGLNCSGLGAVNSAVEGLARALALELGPKIRVNCCSPGMVQTEAYGGMPDDKREAMYAETGASLPVGRVGTAAEIADAVLFLMTNTYLTGQVLDIDGGHTIRQYATR